jgi:hypothetical protein
MHFTSEQRLDDGVLEREFTLGEIPGTLWTPDSTAPAPLILIAHNNGLPKAQPRLVARARATAAAGYAAVTIDAAGCGDRPRSAADVQLRADLGRAMRAGEPTDEIFESLVGPLVENAAPEWRTTLDAVLALPEIGGPVGYSGWTALGIRLAVTDPRITAAASSPGGSCPAPSARRPSRSPFRCCSCCSGTTKATPGSGPWTCSTPSAPRRRHCTPIWADTPAPRGSSRRTRSGSTAGT